MARSMTGFGKSLGEYRGQAISVELSAVNHRYLDCSLRMDNAWTALEPVLKGVVRNHLSRGKIYVSISRKRSGLRGRTLKFDPDLAAQYAEASRELARLLGGDGQMSVDALAGMNGVFFEEEPEEDLEDVERALTQVLEEALGHLDAMRAVEGAALVADLRARVGLLRGNLASVEERLPALNARYEERLRTRIRELQSEATVTEERIAIEVAMLAEKGDVTEEVVRLKTHFDHMEELLGLSEPIGRRLDFLSQELQREVNTLGVKTRDGDVARYVLDMKSELEKIREQIQNIE